MTEVPLLTLNNGVQIPALGFGVFQTPPDETIAAVETALATGYRHIDTAAAYGNEREVGEAIRRSGVDRSEVFVETKVWINDYGYDETLHAFDKSAGKLGVDQIDLLILHQALPGEFDLTLDAYRALEKLLADGKVRAIGVSNFMPDHLARLLAGDLGGAGGQPDRGAPLLPPVRAARGRRRARHPVAGVVADRRHHLLPRRLARQHPSGPDHRRRSPRRTAGHRPRSCCAGTCSRAARSSRSRSPRRGSRRTSTSSTSSSTDDELAAIDALDTGRSRRPGAGAITRETFGREIPEA